MLLKIVAKLDMKPVVNRLKDVDIFDEPKDAEDAIRELSKEKVGTLAFEILAELTPQLGKIADDLPPLIAAYYDISLEEAYKKDAAEVINDLINDEGIVSFFKRALHKKVEQRA
jgi:hypothetical protein